MVRKRHNRREEPVDKSLKPLLNATDVAALLKVSKSQAYALMRRGEMTAVHLGGSVRVTEEDLLAYIEAQKAPKQPMLKVVGR